MSHLPLLILMVISILGLLARSRPNQPFKIPYRSQLAAIGGYAIGLLLFWLLVASLRSILLIPLANRFEFLTVIFSPYHLFRIELWILAGFLITELSFLGGSYDAAFEWKLSLIDGCKAAAVPIAISTLIFFPVWWMLQPGEYGKFRGSFVDSLVAESATNIFSTSPSTLDINEHSKLQARAAIPHAIVIATALAVVLLLSYKGVKYVLGTLDQTYLHLPPKSNSNSNSTRWPFNPRGGGAN